MEQARMVGMDVMVLDMAGDNNYDIKTSMSAMNPQQFENLKNTVPSYLPFWSNHLNYLLLMLSS